MSERKYPKKCWCGVTLELDSEFIAHDCDYYPIDILERDELWESKTT